MHWPSVIAQPTVAPVVFLASSVDTHGVGLVVGVLALILAMTIGLAILGLATSD